MSWFDVALIIFCKAHKLSNKKTRKKGQETVEIQEIHILNLD